MSGTVARTQPAFRIGSDEHKRLFCETFVATHVAFEPENLPWPELDPTSLARLRAIPIWTMALEAEVNAGKMLSGFAQTEPDPLVRQALGLQGYEEDRHGRLLSYMIARYGLNVKPITAVETPTRQAFLDFGYNECVDSFAGFGIFKLACDAKILPESLTSIFTRVMLEEARHIVFFINWIAYDRCRRGYGSPVAQFVPAMLGYGGAIVRRVKGGAEVSGEGGGDGDLDLFGDVMRGLTLEKFLQTAIAENDRYMKDFDPRLLRPRVIPALARFALAVSNFVTYVREKFLRR
jgi:hypothetical protein